MSKVEIDPGFEATEPGFGADASLEEPEEPVEAEAEAEEAEEIEESEPESPTGDDENVDEKTDDAPTDGLQQRIDKLTKNWRETERALTTMEEENRKLQEQLAAIPEPVEPFKTLADFEYNEAEYQAYIMQETATRAEKATEKVLMRHDGSKEAQRTDTLFKSREDAFAKDRKDYHEVVYAQDLRITQVMAEEMKSSEIGPEMGYYLGKHPDEAAEIANKDSRGMIREMARLEDRLMSAKAEAEGEKVSKAPPPQTKKLGGGSVAKKVATTDPRSDKMSDAEWFKREEARLAKQRG